MHCSGERTKVGVLVATSFIGRVVLSFGGEQLRFHWQISFVPNLTETKSIDAPRALVIIAPRIEAQARERLTA